MIVRIDSIAHGGDGVGTLPSGMKVFVPLVAVGDRVEVELVEERAQHARARVLQLIEAGADRVETRCRHAATCGGCQLQQLGIDAQRRAKEEAFYEALARLGGCPREAIPDARPILASPDDFHYRIRCRLHVRGMEIGYLRRGSHDLERLEECGLLAPALETLAFRLIDRLRQRPIAHLSAIDLCVGDDGGGAASLEPGAGAGHGWARRAHELLSVEGMRGLVVREPPAAVSPGRRAAPPGVGRSAHRIFGDPVVVRAAPATTAMRLFGRPDVFAQANGGANDRLVSAAVDGLGLLPGDEVLELFCGAGNFSFALAARGASVTAVESEGEALDLARSAEVPNATARRRAAAGAARGAGGPQLTETSSWGQGSAAAAAAVDSLPGAGVAEASPGRIRFIAGDAAQVVAGFAAEGRRFDHILLDPPRIGAKGLAADLARLAPRRIAYVSCDPATLARDVGALRRHGYAPRSAQPVDMFPQTFHVEGIVILERER